jgi:dihydrofolate reductase
MQLSLIVAMTRGGVIGRCGGLPWRLSSDLKRFKSLTMGHAIIMGRKTFESLPRELPGRKLIFVSRAKALPAPAEVLVASSLGEALRLAGNDDKPYVIGGGEIFEQLLPAAHRLYVTWVEAEIEGDVRFPAVDWRRWREVSAERHSADEKNEYDTTFCIYDRVKD